MTSSIERRGRSDSTEPQNPARRQFLKVLGGITGIAGVSLIGGGLYDVLANTRGIKHQTGKEVDSIIPPVSNQEVEEARSKIEDFKGDMAKLVDEEDYSQLRQIVNEQEPQVSEAKRILNQRNANTELLAKRLDERGVPEREARSFAAVLGGLGLAFLGSLGIASREKRS